MKKPISRRGGAYSFVVERRKGLPTTLQKCIYIEATAPRQFIPIACANHRTSRWTLHYGYRNSLCNTQDIHNYSYYSKETLQGRNKRVWTGTFKMNEFRWDSERLKRIRPSWKRTAKIFSHLGRRTKGFQERIPGYNSWVARILLVNYMFTHTYNNWEHIPTSHFTKWKTGACPQLRHPYQDLQNSSVHLYDETVPYQPHSGPFSLGLFL